jgi:cytochrome c oxidase subunit 2
VITKIRLNSFTNKNLIQGHSLELIWTVIPGLILIQLALPSLILLYTLEDTTSYTTLTLKTLGHQWYWSYSFPEIRRRDTEFDSYILAQSNLETNAFRLLETDNIVNLPYLLNTRVLISRRDVLHSWTVPRLGVKADATPGRLNQVFLISNLPGVFFGQCSEICGANHSFIPIIIQFISFNDWASAL